MVGTSNLGSWNGHWIFQWSSTTQLIFTLLIWTRDLTWPDRKKNLGLQSPGLPRERSLGRWSPGNFFTPHFFMIRFHEFMKEQSSLLVGWWWLMVSDMWFFRHIWDKDVSCLSIICLARLGISNHFITSKPTVCSETWLCPNHSNGEYDHHWNPDIESEAKMASFSSGIMLSRRPGTWSWAWRSSINRDLPSRKLR